MSAPVAAPNQSDFVLNSTGNLANQTMNPNMFNNLNKNVLIEGNPLLASNLLSQNSNTVQGTLNTIGTLSDNKFEDIKTLIQKVECVGKMPAARFGHTMILVSPVKVILFGGAVGDTRNFQFSNDTFELNLMTRTWRSYGIPSSKRSMAAVNRSS